MPSRILRAGRWQDVNPGLLEPAAFLRLCASCFDHSSETAAAGARSVTLYEDQRELLVTQLPSPNDALVVRAVSGPGATCTRLAGPETAIREVLELPAGLLLLGAPNEHAAERLVHAALAGLLERRSLTVLLVSARPARPRREGRGALLVTPREGFDEAVAAFAPDVVAFDVVNAGASLEALHRTPLVVSALVSPDAASLLPRWLARHGLAGGATGLPLAGAEVGLLHSHGVATADGSLPVTALRVRSTPASGAKRPREALASASEDASLLSVIEDLRKDLDQAA
jgi:hypothetical protein